MNSSYPNPFVGKWTYRSFYNDPDLFLEQPDTGDVRKQLYALVLGHGTITILDAPMPQLQGTIGGDDWSLTLAGSRSYGSPMEVRFQGTGIIGGARWIYAYVGYLVPQWPEGVDQRPAIVGSIVRVINHPSSSGGISPAGVVGSWFAVRQGDV